MPSGMEGRGVRSIHRKRSIVNVWADFVASVRTKQRTNERRSEISHFRTSRILSSSLVWFSASRRILIELLYRAMIVLNHVRNWDCLYLSMYLHSNEIPSKIAWNRQWVGQKKLSENHKKEEKAEDGGSAKSHQHVARLSNKQRRKTKEALSTLR